MLTLIAAVDSREAIGASTGSPWHSPEDLRFFREETMGGTLLISYDQLQGYDAKECFVGRDVLVIDSERRPAPPGTLSFPTSDLALRYCHEHAKSRVYVVGGAELYEELLPKAWRVLLSRSRMTISDYKAPTFPAFGEDWESLDHWLLDCGVVPLVCEYVRKL